MIRNFPFSQITFYAYLHYSLTATIAFFLIFELQNVKSSYLNKSASWEKAPWIRLMYELISSFFITTIVVVSCYSFLYLVLWEMPFFTPSVYLYICLVFFVSLCFSAFVNASPIIANWKNSILKAEKLEREAVNAKLEALRTQLSPHFFFNNLSILNGLVDKEPKMAKDFIVKLSEVFRYILRNKNNEIVPLSEELRFIEDYLFLLTSRFEHKIHFQLPANGKNKFWIPPVTLQQLIENAVKHNEISYNRPLNIDIAINDDHLCVSNNSQKRKGVVESTGIGLKNLSERYEILADRAIQIDEGDGTYTVKLPLITYDESRHY